VTLSGTCSNGVEPSLSWMSSRMRAADTVVSSLQRYCRLDSCLTGEGVRYSARNHSATAPSRPIRSYVAFHVLHFGGVAIDGNQQERIGRDGFR
jgi:hypothetical protein